MAADHSGKVPSCFLFLNSGRIQLVEALIKVAPPGSRHTYTPQVLFYLNLCRGLPPSSTSPWSVPSSSPLRLLIVVGICRHFPPRLDRHGHVVHISQRRNQMSYKFPDVNRHLAGGGRANHVAVHVLLPDQGKRHAVSVAARRPETSPDADLEWRFNKGRSVLSALRAWRLARAWNLSRGAGILG
jgi:hypothetical protein